MAIQRADPRARKTALLVVGIVGVLGVAAIAAREAFDPEISAWLSANIHWLIDNPQVIFWAFLVLTSPILGVTAYLFYYARLALHAQRLPPPGYAVIRDTKIIEGIPAVRRARGIQVLSIGLVVLAGAVPVVMWYIFQALA